MLVGSYLTCYLTLKIAREVSNMDVENENPKTFPEFKSISFTHHEKILLNSVVLSKDIDCSFDKIKGVDDIKFQLNKLVINPLKHYDTFKENELLHPPNGIILYGKPGTGKTMLVKALCHHLDYAFITFDSNKIEQKMFGESSKMLSSLFSLANKIKPCVIFIDELDGFFGQRNVLDQSFVNSIKTQMLTLMDGFIKRDPQILFIGATNRLDIIDPAIKRRMRTHISVPLPNQKGREDIFKSYLKKNDLDYKLLANECQGLSGSDIYELCKITALQSLSENNELILNNDNVLKSLKSFLI